MNKTQPFKRVRHFMQMLQAFNVGTIGTPPIWSESRGKGKGKQPHKTGRHGAHMDAVRAARKKHNLSIRGN